MRLVLPADLARAMARLAEAAAPREACGLLLGDGGRIAGLAPSPNLATGVDAFEIDAGLHLRLARQGRFTARAVMGVWHSHPRSAAVPSPRDIAGAWDETLVWLITGTDGTRAFRIAGGAAAEVALS